MVVVPVFVGVKVRLVLARIDDHHPVGARGVGNGQRHRRWGLMSLVSG